MVHSIHRPIEFRNRTWFEDKYRSEVLAIERELREFMQPVHRLAEQAQAVHVVFNNNLRDQGIRGARLFSTLLQDTRSTP